MSQLSGLFATKIRAIPIEQKYTIRDIVFVNREITFHDTNLVRFSLKNTNPRFVTFVVSRITPNRSTTQPTRTNGIRRPVQGHGSLCFVRHLWSTGATKRHRWARANRQVVASTYRGGGATARRKTRKWPEDATDRPGRADALRDGISRTGLGKTVGEIGFAEAGSGFVIRIYDGPGYARSTRPGLAVPHSRELATTVKFVGFEISKPFFFFLLELKCHGSLYIFWYVMSKVTNRACFFVRWERS